MWGVGFRFIITTLTILLLAACGNGGTLSSDEPDDDGPSAIGFNKSAAAPDITILSSMPNDLVRDGAVTCSAVREIFVSVMDHFEGIVVERDVTTRSFETEVDGATVNIDFNPWGEYGCSGNTAELPVCYNININGAEIIRGVILTDGDDDSGEIGEIWMNVNPEGEGLQEISSGGVHLSAKYDMSGAAGPMIQFGTEEKLFGGMEDSAGEINCRISSERLKNGVSAVLLEMIVAGEGGEVVFIARSDGIYTSVKIEGGDLDTDGNSICLLRNGSDASALKDASATTTGSGGSSCSDVDVADHAIAIAP